MIITKSNLTGFISVSGDPYGSFVEPQLSKQLPSVYATELFSIDLTFTHEYQSTPSVEIGPATLITLIDAPKFDVINVLGPNSVRISSDNADVFSDEYYQFLDENKNLFIDKPSVERYDVLVRYKMPNPTVKTITRTFRVTFPSNAVSGQPGFVEDVVISQSVHWRYQTANNNVLDLVARGKY